MARRSLSAGPRRPRPSGRDGLRTNGRSVARGPRDLWPLRGIGLASAAPGAAGTVIRRGAAPGPGENDEMRAAPDPVGPVITGRGTFYPRTC